MNSLTLSLQRISVCFKNTPEQDVMLNAYNLISSCRGVRMMAQIQEVDPSLGNTESAFLYVSFIFCSSEIQSLHNIYQTSTVLVEVVEIKNSRLSKAR